MSKPHPNCWGESGHVCRRPSGRTCLDCDEPAGTLWGPLWCPDCDVTRLDRIGRQMESLLNGEEA